MSGMAFEQLDTLVRVTTVHAWVSLATLFAVCAGAILFSVFYWVPKKVAGEGILLINKDRLSQVRSLGSGRLVKLDVGLGDPVKDGQQIGEISQADIKDAIRETRARLDQLIDENGRLTEFEDKERATQELAVARLEEAIQRTVSNSREGLKVADRIVNGSERLRLISQLSNLDYLKDLQQKYAIQNDLNGGLSKLAELQLTWLTANNQRRRARLQRQIEISKVEMRLQLDRGKLDRTSRIVCHANGTVTQVLTATDEFVSEGAPVVLLSSPRQGGPGTDDAGKAYDSVVFVPAGEGKKIDVDNFVEIMPATVKREEHGYIHGRVVAVSELPATRRAMDAALQHPDLVEAFTKKYAPGVLLRIHIKLDERPTGVVVDGSGRGPDDPGNPFVWSNSSGSKQRLKTGTMCEAAIIVKQQRLISLVLPWLRKLVDTN
jgi:HlyD family secretion protein